MQLSNLKRSKGLKDKSKRLGRGNGSGKGNYSGKGHKGQKARAGVSLRIGFEGGQTSFLQRHPKHKGFKRYFKLLDTYIVLNLGNLEKDTRIENNMDINKNILKKFAYIKKEEYKVKVLGNGEFTKSLNFDGIERFSKVAVEKIQKVGGKISNLEANS